MPRRTIIGEPQGLDAPIDETTAQPHVAEAFVARDRIPAAHLPTRPLAPSPAALQRFRRAGLIGHSAALLHALALAERCARSSAPVSIEG